MKKLLDILDSFAPTIACLMCVGIFIGTFAVLNVTTRPEMMTVALELPARKSEVIMWDIIGDEFPPPPAWYNDHEANIVYYDEPGIFSNQRTYSKEEHICMAKNIYFEARNESIQGQILVALVTIQRVEDPRWPSDVCGVVYDNKQFSWYSDGLSDNPKNKRKFVRSLLVASAILSPDTSMEDFTYNATHYHADYVNPRWAQHMIRLVKVDTHIAYREELEPSVSL